jgi:hypothetical protein
VFRQKVTRYIAIGHPDLFRPLEAQ